jgi:hypothetical protein
MSAGLSGTGLVADDLYLMAHHEASGKPLVQPRALGIGLAGGLLAELMLTDGISVWPGSTVGPGRVRPADGLARQVLGLLAVEHEPHPVREWLLFIARSAGEDVARRLERSGYLTRPGGRIRWRAGRWVPVDPDWAFSPLIRVRSALDPARPPSAYGAVLAGLAAGCGLDFRMAAHLPPAGRTVGEAVGQLDPGLQELIAQTGAAVGSALLAHRA